MGFGTSRDLNKKAFERISNDSSKAYFFIISKHTFRLVSC